MSNLVDITIILDRSGSMSSICESVVKGINDLISDVQSTPGDGNWTLVQFDDWHSASGAGEFFPHILFEGVSDKSVPRLELSDFKPRGSTALVDAVCITIARLKARILVLNEKPRVMIVIVTDGQENASRSFTKGDMLALTSEVQSKYDWKFMYIGANQDAFAEATNYKIDAPMNYRGLASGGRNALPFVTTAGATYEALCSGSVGVRSWKLDNNPTAESLITPCGPDKNLDNEFDR